jgi:hypothetical protein
MAAIHVTDIESAIYWWRERKPSPDGIVACVEVCALAELCGRLASQRETEAREGALPAAARAAWRFTRYAEQAREANGGNPSSARPPATATARG